MAKKKQDQDPGEEPNRVGRPPALEPDEKTLKIVQGLGNIQATSKECAAVLGVSEPTWIAFKKKYAPLIDETYQTGRGQGLVSLRRKQFKLAEKNAAMAIFLGKNYLDQTDKQELSAAVSLDTKGDSARAKLAHFISRQAAGSGEGEGT